MTEPSSPEAEVPIDHFGDKPSPDENTDAPKETVDENDKLEDFQASTGWPDPGFDPPQPDEGVS